MQENLKKLGVANVPVAHVVLGSGYAEALNDVLSGGSKWKSAGEFPFDALSGVKRSTVEGHSGKFIVLKNGDRSMLMQVGRLHGYEGHSTRDVVAPLMASRAMGVKNFILTNSSGSLNPSYKPGDVMVIRDHVNLTGRNPLEGANPVNPLTKEAFGPRFPDLRSLYDREFGDMLAKGCEREKLVVRNGTYLGVLGPNFETPAEVKLFSKWGLDAVGMSTVWEGIALGHSGARVAGLALISNVGCGLDGAATPLDHYEILRVSKASATKIITAVLGTLETLK